MNTINKPTQLDTIQRETLIRNLMCAVLLQAVKDYTGETALCNQTNLPKYYFDKDTILSDLKKEKMVALTGGMSLTVAHQLETNELQIKENLQNIVEDFQLIKVDKYDKPQYR